MDLDKEIKAAQKRMTAYINKLAKKAQAQIAKDFEASRKKLNLTK